MQKECCLSFSLNNRPIGPGHPVYVVAELSGNHHRQFDEAVRLVKAAKEAGADAVKLQTYTAETITIRSGRPEFQFGGGTPWNGRTLWELYEQAHMPWDWQPRLQKVADELDLALFSSPLDPTAVDFLETMDVPAYKVASFELVDLPLIARMAQTGKPLIMATGMATLDEIEQALQTARDSGATEIALLKCTSAYPAPAESMNLKTIPHMAEAFGVPTGLSDHSPGIAVPIAAVALGACIIEKHFTLSRDVPGPDSDYSMEPHEFRAMVGAVRTAEKALGQVHYGTTEPEEAIRAFRRSLFVVKNMRTGETFTPQNVRSIRPAHGLPAMHLDKVLGRRATRDIEAGTPLEWPLIAE